MAEEDHMQNGIDIEELKGGKWVWMGLFFRGLFYSVHM
jgi:hypothetical protein